MVKRFQAYFILVKEPFVLFPFGKFVVERPLEDNFVAAFRRQELYNLEINFLGFFRDESIFVDRYHGVLRVRFWRIIELVVKFFQLLVGIKHYLNFFGVDRLFFVIEFGFLNVNVGSLSRQF